MFPMTKEDYDKNEFALNATWTSFTSKKKKKNPKDHKYKSQLYQFCKTHFFSNVFNLLKCRDVLSWQFAVFL